MVGSEQPPVGIRLWWLGPVRAPFPRRLARVVPILPPPVPMMMRFGHISGGEKSPCCQNACYFSNDGKLRSPPRETLTRPEEDGHEAFNDGRPTDCTGGDGLRAGRLRVHQPPDAQDRSERGASVCRPARGERSVVPQRAGVASAAGSHRADPHAPGDRGAGGQRGGAVGGGPRPGPVPANEPAGGVDARAGRGGAVRRGGSRKLDRSVGVRFHLATKDRQHHGRRHHFAKLPPANPGNAQPGRRRLPASRPDLDHGHLGGGRGQPRDGPLPGDGRLGESQAVGGDSLDRRPGLLPAAGE